MDVDGAEGQFATALRQVELMHDLPQPRNDGAVQDYPSQESIVARYSDAARLAATPKEGQLTYPNRSLANLNLNRPEQALLDATRTAEKIPPTEMALFREIRALYALRYFDRCLERLEKFTALHPASKDAKTQMSRVQQRLREQADGVYSFTSMHEQAN
ncbi:TPR domain protein [Cordyceps fumosorosea ARSEF 2679]|uniref:TPR domain protein n=1 Tax=Cordyceps fumosorosea (strain ARSEF 2679) TaxID=1081104 RepID=A0A162MSS5_CORFA|nr:TPR domain protein [Cordyceps fumosorosea ARSEF 2679]OAA69749.1 TPR domain protein [Cordyceps fumosorosea ARSEF 2679]